MNNIFNLIANDWWNIKGVCQPLHELNRIRFNFIKRQIKLKNKNILDIGCGAGILSEKLATHGANVTGIDSSYKLINIAKQHAKKKNLTINYININFDKFIKENDNLYDIIICTEVIEHLKNKNILFNFINKNVKNNNCIILSSLNKNIITYINIIFFGEYISNKLKKNTHDFYKFIPINKIKLLIPNIKKINGLLYNPLKNYAKLSKTYNTNYIIKIK